MSEQSMPWSKCPTNFKLFNYIIEKTKHAVSPFCQTQLAREFKRESGAPEKTSSLVSRIQNMRPIIHEIEDIDTDTKVKLLFALSTPINNEFLEYLQNRAEVILDSNQRIIKYREYGGGGLKLKGIHAVIYNKSELMKKDKKMMELLAQKALSFDSPITNRAFLRDFKKTTAATEHMNSLEHRYRLLKNKIHESADFDEKTKVRMIFVSGASVPDCFLEILRKDALVEVDKINRITKYRANDGSLSLEGVHSPYAKIKSGKIESKESLINQINNYYENKTEQKDEMSKLIEFITEKCENVVDLALSSTQLVKEFSKQPGMSTEFSSVHARVKLYCREIQRLEVVDTPTKVRQLFALRAPLNIDFLEELRNKALVEVDDRNRIIKYTANDGSLTLERSLSSSQFDSEGNENIEESKIVTTKSGRVSKKRNLYIAASPQKQYSSKKKAFQKSTSKRLQHSRTDQLEDSDVDSDDFQIPEMKFESFHESVIDGFAPIDSDGNIRAISISNLREPKIEVEEEQFDIEMMEFSNETEEDFIIPKLEELEEAEDTKPEFTF